MFKLNTLLVKRYMAPVCLNTLRAALSLLAAALNGCLPLLPSSDGQISNQDLLIMSPTLIMYTNTFIVEANLFKPDFAN